MVFKLCSAAARSPMLVAFLAIGAATSQGSIAFPSVNQGDTLRPGSDRPMRVSPSVNVATSANPSPPPPNTTCIDKNHTMYVCGCGGWSSTLIDCDFDCHCGLKCTKVCCKTEWCKNGSGISDIGMLQHHSSRYSDKSRTNPLSYSQHDKEQLEQIAAGSEAHTASAKTTDKAGSTAGSHLKYMSYYGFNPALMHGWVNMGLEAGLEVKLQAYKTYGIPSFYGDLPAEPAAGAIFKRGVGLADDWEANLEALVAKDVIPNLGKDKALRGVFLGDEICCMNATCWDTALKPVTEKLRALLGKDALIYTNECANHEITEVPAEFDLISVDVYAGFKPGSHGTDEVTAAKKMYDIIFPKLHDHQKAILVPGTFACSNLTYFPLDAQAKNLVDKLDGYFEWAKSDKRIAGFNPWHFNNRSNPQAGGACDMELGAVAMPSVYAKLQEIGKFILGNA